MHWFVAELRRQFELTRNEPARFFRLLREFAKEPGRIRRYQSVIAIKRKVGDSWTKDETLGIQSRVYRNYADYLEHQASKLQHVDLRDYDLWFRDCLAKRLALMPEVKPGMSVVCLAARLGTEVRAFQDVGCFAVGIDLNPGPNNKYVLYGDFHQVQFPKSSVDIVYTNSIDHAFDVSKMFSEVTRLMKPTGIFMLEVPLGNIAKQSAEDYESLWWDSAEALERMIVSHGFRRVGKQSVDRPFSGLNLVFQADSEA